MSSFGFVHLEIDVRFDAKFMNLRRMTDNLIRLTNLYLLF
jgi:hypothetical protein